MRHAALLASLLGLTACAAPREQTDFRSVSSENAAIRWQRRNLTLPGRAVCERAADGAVRLRLYENSSPLLELVLDASGRLSSSGHLAGHGWTGQAGAAPPVLAIWAAFLETYQHSAQLPPGDREVHAASTRIACSKTADGHLRSLSVANIDTAETLSALFSPP